MIRIGACLFALCISTMSAEKIPFGKYPAEIFRGRPASPRFRTTLSREHKTVIRNRVRRGPDFAGHYTLVSWGCGTSCAVFIIVDVLNGQIYEPPEISRGVDLGLGGPEYRRDSTLLVLANCPDPRVYGYKHCERRFYNWGGSRLFLLKTESVTPSSAVR